MDRKMQNRNWTAQKFTRQFMLMILETCFSVDA